MNIGVIGNGCAGLSRYEDLIKQALQLEPERKLREALLESYGVKSEDEYYQRNLYQSMINMINTGQEVMELQKAFDEIAELIQQEPTIEQLKKQIKYSKNPLEVKMLNKKLNQIYKDNRSR